MAGCYIPTPGATIGTDGAVLRRPGATIGIEGAVLRRPGATIGIEGAVRLDRADSLLAATRPALDNRAERLLLTCPCRR
ncbi:MAG: hypothetical protein NVSMB25_05930 [Thermoleophilaceae bacterium]